MKEVNFYIKKELDFLQKNLNCYLQYWPINIDQVNNTTYSLLELASHLYTLPAAYCALFNGIPEDDLLKLWGGPWNYKSIDDFREILDKGMTEIMSHKFLSMRDEILIPWTFGNPISAREHCVNLITHMYHHRGQMHLLLKQAGAKIDTGTIYMTSEGRWRTD